MSYSRLIGIISLSLVSSLSFAAEKPYKIIGNARHSVVPTQQQTQLYASNAKVIILPTVRLSKDARKSFKEKLNKHKNLKMSMIYSDRTPPGSSVSLGMNNMPVLDQGAHGSCVTFAVSAALDAIINGKDDISQLCSLELGSYLEEQNPDYLSGWEGSWGPLVFSQFKQYGVISKQDQREKGCAGFTKYPLYNPDNIGAPMSIDEYNAMSHPVMQNIEWRALLNDAELVNRNFDFNVLVQRIKTALSEGHRVVIGFVLDPMSGQVGAIGTNKVRYDTWAVNNDLINQLNESCNEESCDLAGHEVIITGFDDNASVDGNKGVFTIRNSWSDQYGDKGNFYMTYDYVKMLVDEAESIQAK